MDVYATILLRRTTAHPAIDSIEVQYNILYDVTLPPNTL